MIQDKTSAELLAERSRLQAKRAQDGALSTADSLALLKVTQILDARAAQKDPVLV